MRLEPIDLEPEIDIGLRVEVRRAGQPTKEWSRSSGPAKNPQEASFSLRETTDPDVKKRYQLITALIDDGPSSHTINLPDFWPEPDKFGSMSRTNRHLEESVDLAEKVEVPVWSFFVNDNGRAAKDFQKEVRIERDAQKTTFRFGNTFEEEINSSPCALVVSLWWEHHRR